MVEPMPNNFEILEKNLSSYPDIKPLNVAVTDKPGQLDFYYLKDIKDQEPDWYDQVGSLDKATFYKNISVCPELENRVGITQIECLTFDEVARKNSLAKVDLIMIDTEGYDYNILATIDLQKYQPRILIFEYEWLTNYEMKLAKKKLADANYKILLNGQDCIAYKNN